MVRGIKICFLLFRVNRRRENNEGWLICSEKEGGMAGGKRSETGGMAQYERTHIEFPWLLINC